MSKRVRDAAAERRSQTQWGIFGVIALVIILVACGVIYFVPFGHRGYHAQFTRTGGARVGDEVRIAGIQVGKVTAVKLSGNHVDVDFNVKKDVNVGDRSSLSVELLTAIGGRYLLLHPAGTSPLGDSPIPVDRTQVPYTLPDALAGATPLLDQVDGDVIRKNIAEINRALDGAPDAIRNILGTTSDVVTAIGQRNSDIDSTLAVTNEYLAAANQNDAQIFGLLRNIGSIGAKLATMRQQTIAGAVNLKIALHLFERLFVGYAEVFDPSVVQLNKLGDQLSAQPEQIGQMIDQLRNIVAGLSAMYGVDTKPTVGDTAAPVVPTICVPSAASAC